MNSTYRNGNRQQAHGGEHGDEQQILDEANSVGFVWYGTVQGLDNAGDEQQQQQSLGREKPGCGNAGHGQPALGSVHGAESSAAIELPDGNQVEEINPAPTWEIASQLGHSVTR